jgi:hypothetical protein
MCMNVDIFWTFLGFLAGIGATLLFIWLSNRNAYRIVQKQKSVLGNEAKVEQSARLMSFIAEMKAAYDEEAAGGQVNLKDFGVKRALPIVLKYPDVVARHGKQLLKLMGGNGNELSGLLQGII